MFAETIIVCRRSTTFQMCFKAEALPKPGKFDLPGFGSFCRVKIIKHSSAENQSFISAKFIIFILT